MGNEIHRIAKLLGDLQHGNCWIGMNMEQVLQDINADLALRKIDEKSNCIWQIVNHIIYWRKRVINRLTGVKGRPEYPDLTIPENPDEASWTATLKDFSESYSQLRKTIEEFPETKIDDKSPRPEFTYYELMHGLIQHDSYHLGQFNLLKKYLN